MASLPSFSQKRQKKEDTSFLTKKDTVFIVGHAHQDMSWLWTYAETMKMCNDNLRQTCAFVEEFPDFQMVQSEGSVYNFVEQADPELFEKVKQYVKEGRIEPVGGMWVESDQNMPSGEGLARSFLLGQRYYMDNFGRISHVGWLPDDFGHTAQLPQMLRLTDQKYFFFMRCGAYDGSFWWKGPDGSTVLCYTGGSYNGGTSLKEFEDCFKAYSNGQGVLFHSVGVGDHGGGPTRENINTIHEIDAMKKGPAVKFTTAESFFKNLENNMEGRPTHEGEMQYIFEGCYTTVAENKEGNRNCERSLYQSEFFNTLRWLDGDDYPGDQYREIWRTVALNQFHDILTGSAVYESNRENVSRYMEAYRKSNELRDRAFHKSIDQIAYQKGLGQPIVAYNLHPYGHKSLVEADVYSYEMPKTAELSSWADFYGSKIVRPKDAGQGPYPTVLVRDGEGHSYPAQIVWGKLNPPYYLSRVQFVCDDIPAGGYKTFYVDVQQPGVDNEPIKFENNTFDTDFYKIRIDPKTGDITSLILKETGTEYVKEGCSLNTLRMFEERKDGGMKSWTINGSVNVEDVTEVLPVTGRERDWTGKLVDPEKGQSYIIVENGPVRATIEATKVWGRSKFIVRTYIYKSYPRIDYDVDVHWLEVGGDDVPSPMLRAVFPLATQDSRFYCDVPFAVVERPANGKFAGGEVPKSLMHTVDNPSTVEMNEGQEVPAQRWVDVNNGKEGIALMNRTKYGHAYHNGELRLTLMRSAGNPDIYPNLGRFVINYSLYPHTGGWQNGVRQEGENYNSPVFAAEPLSLSLKHENANLPEKASLVSLNAANVEMTGFKRSEDGDELVVRLCEMEGKETQVELNLPVNVNSARRLNLMEYALEGAAAPSVQNKTVKVTVKPYEIVTLGIK